MVASAVRLAHRSTMHMLQMAHDGSANYCIPATPVMLFFGTTIFKDVQNMNHRACSELVRHMLTGLSADASFIKPQQTRR
jgi:hypothetical protein